MPSRSSSQNAARGNINASTTTSPLTDSRYVRPVCPSPRSYRCGTMDTSSSGSMIRAAAMLSSRARLTGCLPCAWERTTVSFCRLMGVVSVLFGVDLALDHLLCLFPAVGEELVIRGDVQQDGGIIT